jgi:alanine dehydrogenase
MRIGIPREIKDGEFRVALTPSGVAELAAAGHELVIGSGLGLGVGFSDQDYEDAGARTGNPWDAELVVKVKELQKPEFGLPRAGQTVCGFQQFGLQPDLLDAALASGATFLVYSTVGQADGSLPVLAPMSAISGRLAVLAGAWCLQKQNGGSGVLLGGAEGAAPGKVVILGAGNVGSNALAVARGIGADVAVFAKSSRRFAALRMKFPGVILKDGNPEGDIVDADLVIGGVLTPGQMSPKIITRAMLRRMRPGSALVDVGIDQGGIAETSRLTSYRAPTYVEEGVVHYCVPNMPAATPRTASLALERAALPFVLELLSGNFSSALKTGFQVKNGKVTHEHLARDTGRAFHPL